ncbi:hypothetical protein [Ideonella sp.]|uniref:hypothetical protein n=1 Tax=Ideonella sp. TaxID=1929293 RepID=UPI003BB68DAB
MKLRVTPCFRCRMLRVGVLMAPVALLSSWLPAREPASALRWLAAWLALYALICVVWWAITQRRRWMTTQGPASD